MKYLNKFTQGCLMPIGILLSLLTFILLIANFSSGWFFVVGACAATIWLGVIVLYDMTSDKS